MMINDIVVNILNKKSEPIKIEMIGDLADEFRAGRNPSELLELLESDDENILNIALYILGEINIASISILKEIVKKLEILSVHKESQIRYKTLINLASLSHKVNTDKLNNIYKKMSQDSNESISKTAKELLRNGNLRF
jgi:hypothetical protein